VIAGEPNETTSKNKKNLLQFIPYYYKNKIFSCCSNKILSKWGVGEGCKMEVGGGRGVKLWGGGEEGQGG
jgi:hypothetical protein